MLLSNTTNSTINNSLNKDIDYSLWNFKEIQQEFTSENTSINAIKMPKTIKKIEPILQSGQKWADIGGGKFDNLQEHLIKFGVELFIYDPFNRSQEHNQEVVQHISNAQCDGVMVNNVLNVILEPQNRLQVIQQAFDCLKQNGTAYFKIYEGDCSGIVKKSTNNSSSAQLNQPAYFFVDEIQKIFGNKIKVSKEFLVVTKDNNLNLNMTDNLIAQSKSYDIPQRYVKTGVGKNIGGNLYVHKDYVDIFPSSYSQALLNLTQNAPEFQFHIVKFNKEKNTYSFIQSLDFDTKDEPTVGDSIQVDYLGHLKLTKKKSDPQIYHHKWNFVKDDYKGFDTAKSIQRSISWKSIMGKNKELSSKIGTSSFWEKTLISLSIIKESKSKNTI